MKFFPLIFCLIPVLVLAQRPFKEGYVNFGGYRGVVMGYVQVPKKQSGLAQCYFRQYPRDIMQEVRAERVIGFGFVEGDAFHSIRVTRGDTTVAIFAKVLVDGNLSLYDDNETLILKQADGSVVELGTANYKNILLANTTACPATNEAVPLVHFGASSLTSVIEGYNKCLRNDPTTFDPFQKSYSIHLGISTGIEFSKLNVEQGAFPAFTLFDQKRISAGVLAYIPFSRNQAVELGALYKPRRFVGLAQSGSTIYELTVRYDEILIPLVFRQILRRSRGATLQGSFGIALPLLLDGTVRMATETDSSGTIITRVSSPYTSPSKGLQFNLGFGAEFRIANRRHLLIHNNFFYATGSLTSSTKSVGSNGTGYSFYIGYTLL